MAFCFAEGMLGTWSGAGVDRTESECESYHRSI